jgi:hypothetical protein
LRVALSPGSAYTAEIKRLKGLDEVERCRERAMASQTLAILDQIALEEAEEALVAEE